MKQIDRFVSLDFTEYNPSGEAQKKVQSRLTFLGFPPKSSQPSLLTPLAHSKQGRIIYKRRKTTAATVPFIIVLTLVVLLYLTKFFHMHLTIQLCLGNRGRQNYSPSLHIRRRQRHPTPVLLPGKNPMDRVPGRLQSMGSLRVGYDCTTSLSLLTFMHWRRKWQPTPVFLPGESQGRGSQGAAIYGVTQSRTRLKRLSSSSSSSTSYWGFSGGSDS